MVGRAQRGLRHRQQLGLVRPRLGQVLDAQRMAAEQALQHGGIDGAHRYGTQACLRSLDLAGSVRAALPCAASAHLFRLVPLHAAAYDSCSESFLPHAWAYLRSVVKEGECLPVASARSRRATAGA